MHLIAALLAAVLSLPGTAMARKNVPAPAVGAVGAPDVKPLREVALYPARRASAQVVALNESRVAAEIAGRIEAIAVQVGERIPRGARIARIDCGDHQLALERAGAALASVRARHALAEQHLERARALRARNFVSDEVLAGRETELRVLAAELATAQVQRASAERNVSRCDVRAPFAAVVRQRLGQVGELAAPGTPLALLLDIDALQVAALVQVGDIESFARADGYRLDTGEAEWPLRLLRISPAIDPQARIVEARLQFSAAQPPPGASGSVHWRDPRPHVAPDVVVRRNGRLGVFIARGGQARFEPLPAAQEGRPALAPFPLGTPLVVSGQQALQDGAPLAGPAR